MNSETAFEAAQAKVAEALAMYIIKNVTGVGAGGNEILALAEEVVAFLVLSTVKPGSDDVVLPILFRNITRRIEDARAAKKEETH